MIAVTSARDADVVRHAVAQGVMLYLLKPFTFAGFRAKLEQYAAYRAELDQAPAEFVQDEVDRLLGSLRGASSTLPKGMSPETLRDVTVAVREAGAGLSATEVAEAVGASRVTVRRYLEHLADTGTRRAAPEVRPQRPARGGVPLEVTRQKFWRVSGGRAPRGPCGRSGSAAPPRSRPSPPRARSMRAVTAAMVSWP